jgi:hypothetical protein
VTKKIRRASASPAKDNQKIFYRAARLYVQPNLGTASQWQHSKGWLDRPIIENYAKISPKTKKECPK